MDALNKTKILWAIDPFSSETALQRSTARTIKTLTATMPAVIEPVYAWNTLTVEEIGFDAQVYTLREGDFKEFELRRRTA